MIRRGVTALIRALYRVRIHGRRNFPGEGKAALIVANHLSLLDGALLALFLPGKVRFAVNTYIARKWWVKPFLRLVHTFPMDPSNPMAIKRMMQALRDGEKCVIFPEGRITVTGALMKVYEGPGIIADKTGVPLIPVRIDGAQYSMFSYLKGKVRTRWFPQITLTVLPPIRQDLPEDLRGKKRRKAAGDALYAVMSDLMFDTSPYKQPLIASLIDASVLHGRRHAILTDIKRGEITYGKLITGAFALGGIFRRRFKHGDHIGVLLPNVNAAPAVFFGLHVAKNIPAMLNFSAGAAHIEAACKAACISHVITSRSFIDTAGLQAVIAILDDRDITVHYLEDIAPTVTKKEKIFAWIQSIRAPYVRPKAALQSCDDIACILFTSGSEGLPKGVALSHKNLQANRYQLSARIDFGPTDIVFNALPVFHAFGLTGGLLLPLLGGVKTILYPSPLHYKIIPELVYEYNATILFGTDTFLDGYARSANPYDFYSLRYVFAGAERVKERTRAIWAEKFGLRILEGYGATECSPAISVNTPMYCKAGSVGKLLPGMHVRLRPVSSGSEDAGRLCVKGPNIMKGYYRADAPGVLEIPEDGEYDTGDIVRIDEDGFLFIEGRAKRFAKVAGEMVSLTAAEIYIDTLYPDKGHAVIAVTDDKKGEQLALLTEHAGATRKEIAAFYREHGHSELALPRYIYVTDTLPLLGSGKVDYKQAEQMLLDMLRS